MLLAIFISVVFFVSIFFIIIPILILIGYNRFRLNNDGLKRNYLKYGYSELRNQINDWISQYGVIASIFLVLSILFLVLGFTFFIFFIGLLCQKFQIGNLNNENVNSAKDIAELIDGFFGTIVSLVGALLLYVTLLLQSKQISIQLKELNNASQTILLSKIEATLFSLIEQNNQIVLKQKFAFTEKNYSGYDLLNKIYWVYEETYKILDKNNTSLTYDDKRFILNYLHMKDSDEKQKIKKFEEIKDEWQSKSEMEKIDILIRNVNKKFEYQIRDYIKSINLIILYLYEQKNKLSTNKSLENEIDNMTKIFFTRLSTNEINIIFYNLLSAQNDKNNKKILTDFKYKDYIGEGSLIKHDHIELLTK